MVDIVLRDNGSPLTIDLALNQSPTVALNTPADAGSTSDTTPALVFTGTDAESDDIRYQLNLWSLTPSAATPTAIDTASDFGVLPLPPNQILEASNGYLYAILEDMVSGGAGDGNLEMWRSTDGGSSWSLQDGSTSITTHFHSPSFIWLSTPAAIDSNDVIHVCYTDSGGNFIYRTFSGTTWGSTTNLGTETTGYGSAIAVDSNDKVHIVRSYLGGMDSYLQYRNNVSGSWSNVTIESVIRRGLDLAVDNDNLPIISAINTSGNLMAYKGNLNNATSFTTQTVTTANATIETYGTSIAISSTNDIWLAYVNSSGVVSLVEHQSADGWSTWQTPINNSNSGKEPTLFIYRDKLFVFYQDDNDDIVYDSYDGSWGGETVLHSGTYEDAKVSWSNYQTPTKAHYLYSDGTDVYYSNLSFVDITLTSGTDAGFSGSPDNTDPFTSGQQVTYTVQDALDPGTYYWRVRGIDPSGSNSYGAWSTTRSFEITSGSGVTVTPDTASLTITGYAPTVQTTDATVQFLQATNDISDLSEYTFSSQNLGTASSDRYIVVAVNSRKAGATTTITSVTVAGITATQVVQNSNNVSNTNVAGLYIVNVPTGTSGDIVVTFGATMVRAAIQVWRLTAVNPTAHDSDSNTADDPSVNLDIPDNGIVIGSALTASASSASWTGLTEDHDNTLESFVTVTAAHDFFPVGESGRTITADFGSSTESVGVFASFGEAVSNAVNVTPDPASLSLTFFAPTVTVTNHQTVVPSTLSLTITGYAPTVATTNHQTFIPSTASLTITTYAPTVSVTNHITVVPDTASLAITGYAPTVTATNNITVVPDTLSLAITTFEPTVGVTNHITVTPDTASLTITGYSPSVSIGNNITVTPATASLTITGFAPTVSVTDNITVVPETASLTITGHTPTVFATNHQTFIPDTLALAITGYAPDVNVTSSVFVVPDPATLTITTFAPTVSITDHVFVTPAPAVLRIKTYAPAVNGVFPTRPYYIDTNGNVFWVINEEIGLVERV